MVKLKDVLLIYCHKEFRLESNPVGASIGVVYVCGHWFSETPLVPHFGL